MLYKHYSEYSNGDGVLLVSVESWPGALQTTQKHIRGWKICLEAEMRFPVSEAYGLPVNAKSLVVSVMSNLCGSHYPLHMAMRNVSSQRILVDKAFSRYPSAYVWLECRITHISC